MKKLLLKIKASFLLLSSSDYILLTKVNDEFHVDMSCKKNMSDAYLSNALNNYISTVENTQH